MIKVIPAVAGLVSASALTTLLFNVNLKEFLTVRTGNNSGNITLRELFNLDGITNYGIGGGTLNFTEYIKRNIADNWMMAAGTLVAVKAIPKIMTKLSITRQANALSKNLGLGGLVQL
jgi:hypothetical protein